MPELSLDRLLTSDRLRVSFGESLPTAEKTLHPTSIEQVSETITQASTRGVISTPSSGWLSDWTTNSGGDCLMLVGDLLEPAIEWIDWEGGVARVQGGALVQDVTAELIANGWCPHTLGAHPLMSIGSAVSANVSTAFGGNGGRFADGIVAVELIDGNGVLQRLDPQHRAEGFYATVGGLGLTGVIVAVEMRIRAINTAWMLVDTNRADSFEMVLERLNAAPESVSSYATIDPTGTGTATGRGVVMTGRHAKVSDLPSARVPQALAYERTSVGSLDQVSQRVGRNRAGRVFHSLRHQTSAPTQVGQLQTIAQFFETAAAGIPESSAQVVRYDVEIPTGAIALVPTMLTAMTEREVPSSRVVLSKISEVGADLLNSVGDGWRFGFTVPADSRDAALLLDRFDEQVLTAGGHVVLSSDGRVRPRLVPHMFPTIDGWRGQRVRLDPDQRFASDFARRLEL